MLQFNQHFIRTAQMNRKLAAVFQRRMSRAVEHFTQRTRQTFDGNLQGFSEQPLSAWNFWGSAYPYALDFIQRAILFWDTMRQRGNQYLAHERAGKPPVLRFKYETVLDARKFKRPVNYALLRILAPEGVSIDSKRRPYIIIDPRAGHGPGIGGFKDDSQVGVALREGHPVYFVTFFPEPEPGQSLLDVTAAEQQFVKKVRELHPESPKPVLVGNCQGGWAAMMLAASEPEDTGPIVINGAPMSYWSGAWGEGEEDNPMRYAAGLLGGTWLASFAADTGNGVFDGAWLVQNFENLNPANTFWDKYYNLFANVDKEPPRFLEFERWWGGFFLMNREEIEWITRNLFVGNKLWSGDVRSRTGQAFDLRQIQAPIILFASLGDNITPPQQAFNWVADIYGSTAEIKARGQVIVGLLHRNIGHLGIFVSGKVAKKEHTQLVSVLKSVEALPPGLYAMEILERKTPEGKTGYEVQFVERDLEEVRGRLNRFQRADEKPFTAVQDISEFNQRAYELFVRPLVQGFSSEAMARAVRALHPLRIQHWAVSDFNPWLAWLGPMAEMVKRQRHALDADAPGRRVETALSEVVSASLDFYREFRDAVSEVLFFEMYGNLFSLEQLERPTDEEAGEAKDEVQLALKREVSESFEKGGYPEAVARVFSLLARPGKPFPLAQIHLKQTLAKKFADLLPATTVEQQRRIRGLQDLVVRRDRGRALAALPKLVENREDRNRLLILLNRVVEDEGVRQLNIVPEQIEMLQRIRAVLAKGVGRARKAGGKRVGGQLARPSRGGRGGGQRHSDAPRSKVLHAA